MFLSWTAKPAGVTLRSGMSTGSEALVVSPSEVTRAGRLEVAKRFICRVVEIEITDDLFSCYVLCGMDTKDMIQAEAWRELSRAARSLLQEGSSVSLSNVLLSLGKQDKNKYSPSGCRMFVRLDKDATFEHVDIAADCTVPGYAELKAQDLPRLRDDRRALLWKQLFVWRRAQLQSEFRSWKIFIRKARMGCLTRACARPM